MHFTHLWWRARIEAREIEFAFEMLPGWMDRDILKLFSLEDKDVKLIDSISKTEDKWKKLIIQLIDNI